ncbi:cyclic nucleotide-binding domain-containing protein, partial [Trichothermofontia sp.]
MTQPTTPQTVSQAEIRDFIRQIAPFDRLSTEAIDTLLAEAQLRRYPIGRPMLVHDKLPVQISIIYDGQVRVLGQDQRAQSAISLRLAGPGEVLGWAGLVRGVPCETAIASSETVCLNITAETFLRLLKTEAPLRSAFQDRCSLNELFELLGLELQRRADGTADLKQLTYEILPDVVVCTVPPGGKVAASPTTGAVLLDPDRIWLISAGSVGDIPTGGRVSFDTPTQLLSADRTHGVRLIGIHEFHVPSHPVPAIAETGELEDAWGESTTAISPGEQRRLA